MARTMFKKRKLRESQGSGKDRISNLPSDVLHQILSNLSTKDSVSTSVLSKRWKKLWKHVPALDLDSNNLSDDWALDEFFDSYMELNKNLKRFKLIYNPIEHSHSDFVSRIDDVVESEVRHLTLLNKVDGEEDLVRMPLSLYTCATFLNLTLFCVVLDFPESVMVSLPCVETMHLEAVKFDGDSVLETLISSCSVLNDLIIITHPGDLLQVVCVRSQSLKCFKLESMRAEFEECGDPSVEIDAPKLKFMSITGYQYESFIIHCIDPSAKVNIHVIFDVDYDDPLERAVIGDFLTTISTVREMKISAQTLEVLMNHFKA